MKRFVCLLLVLILVPAAVFCESPLSDLEQNYPGAWCMYADNGKGTIYVIVITFLDNMEVVQKSLTFKNGQLDSDNKASGIWGAFTDKAILLTLAGTDMTAMIKDDGYLYLYFLEGLKLCGIYSKCPDLTPVLGW